MNGIRLLGRVVLATAVVAATARKEFPAALKSWLPTFSQVAVTSMRHGSDKMRLISMWKDTVVNNKENRKLNSLHMCSSLVGKAVNIEEVIAAFDKHMSLIDPHVATARQS